MHRKNGYRTKSKTISFMPKIKSTQFARTECK